MFAFVSRKFSRMSTRSMHQTSSPSIYLPCPIALRSPCQKNRLRVVFIHCVNSAVNAFSATTSCTLTCANGTRNVSYANEMRSEINSAFHFKLRSSCRDSLWLSFKDYEHLVCHAKPGLIFVTNQLTAGEAFFGRSLPVQPDILPGSQIRSFQYTTGSQRSHG